MRIRGSRKLYDWLGSLLPSWSHLPALHRLPLDTMSYEGNTPLFLLVIFFSFYPFRFNAVLFDVKIYIIKYLKALGKLFSVNMYKEELNIFAII